MKTRIFLFIFSAAICIGCSKKIYQSFLQEITDPRTASITINTGDTATEIRSAEGQRFYYKSLYGLDYNSIIAYNNTPVNLYIQRPTLVKQEKKGTPLLLLPKDTINIEFDIYGQMKFAASSKQRELELIKIHDWYYFLDSLGGNLEDFSMTNPIFKDQDAYITNIKFQSKANYLFKVADSALHLMLSKGELEIKNKKSFQNFLFAYIISIKLNYYWETKNNSKIDSIYDIRYTELVSFFNTINTHADLAFYYDYLWELFRQMVTYKLDVPAIYDSASLKIYLTEARRIFSGVSYNYLVANVIYFAYKNKGINSKEFMHLKSLYVEDKYYKAALRAIIKSYQDAEFFVNTTIKKSFVSLNGNSATSENDLVEKFKGKLVFVDFWSSWCIPCRKEMPAMRSLKREYLGKEIVFITISIDNSLLAWQKASNNENLESDNSFLLRKQDSVFKFKERIINEIPRYFLLGKDGSIISDNAPSPGEDSLKKMINQYLLK